MIFKKKFVMFFIFIPILYANDIQISSLAKSLHLSAGSKAIIQWERIFQSERKMKRYKINKLNKNQKEALEKYLINHAIDSDQPTIAGV
jgi:hypothetical protein